MTVDPFSTPGRCPVCGAKGACPDGAPVPLNYPPFDPASATVIDSSGPVRRYRVTQFGYETAMLLNDADAATYGDAATLDEG